MRLPELIIWLVVFAVTSATVTAAPPEAAIPATDAVLLRYIEAIGGVEKLAVVRTRVTRSVIKLGLADIKVETREAWPDRFVEIATFSVLGATSNGYDGTTGWAQKSGERARRVQGAELQKLILPHRLDRVFNLESLYPQRSLLPEQTVGGRRLQPLLMTSAVGTETWSFDAGTGLLAQVEGQDVRDGKKIAYTVTLDDYRVVDGVKYPFRITTTAGRDQLNGVIESISHNMPVTIAPPRDMKK